MSNSNKPKPLKVFGRTHYACTRCKLSKIRCSGEKPACTNCKSINKSDACVYPNRDRKIVIMESDLNQLHEKVSYLEQLVKQNGIQEAQLTTNNAVRIGESKDLITGRLIDTSTQTYSTEDSYIIADQQNQVTHVKLMSLCGQKLPDIAYTLRLVNKVYNTYSSEFYLMDLDDTKELVSSVYSAFQLYSDSDESAWVTNLISRVPSSSLCYLFIIIAFGEQLYNINTVMSLLPHPNPERQQKVPGIDYYLLASQLFSLTQEETSIQFIQCSLLLALYSANLNRYNTVYNYFGVAVRSAVANGFHRQRELPRASDEHARQLQKIKEEKTKRLWWSIFVIDTTWAAKMNMPVHIEYTDTDVDLPIENGRIELGDDFNSEILEVNVHLTKYIARFIKLIYGPNIRSFSISYINTDQFNQKLLVKNTILCLNDITTNFEVPFLSLYKTTSIIEPVGRCVGNLFLRYHQLIIMITRSLICLLSDHKSQVVIENPQEVDDAVVKGLMAASNTVEITSKFYEYNKMFVLGFFDSQHLFSALLILIMTTHDANTDVQIHKGIALLKFMAQNNNINAQNCMKRLKFIGDLLAKIPETPSQLDLSVDIQSFIQKRHADQLISDEDFFNPSQLEEKTKATIYEKYRKFKETSIEDFSESSKQLAGKLVTASRNWDNFRGLPIHVSGTSRLKFEESLN